MELFQRILDKLQTPNNESLKMSLNHCHVRGMFSLVVDGLYSEPAMFQINDKCQVVIRELKKILENYRLA